MSAIHRFFAYADDLSPASERSPDGEQPELVRYASERGWHRLAQRGLRLGSRMANALRDSWSFTGDSVILLRGTDAPGLPEASVSALVDAAMSGSFAVVAADDGGYVAAALALSATSIPALDLLFADDLPWGTDGVLGATKAAATRTGLALEVVGRWRDIDLPEDIAEFVEPSTAAWRRRVVEHAPKTAKLLVELARQLPEMKPR